MDMNHTAPQPKRIKFRHDLLDLVRRGLKTQTRRAEQDGDYPWVCGYIERADWPRGHKAAYGEIRRADHAIRWQRDAVYEAVDEHDQPTEPPTHIRVIALWHETDVRELSHEDAEAEGFTDTGWFVETWESIYPHAYRAWVIQFEVVNDAEAW